ncbi:MAG: hypothetical protein ACRD2X_20195 [Vicinamibacteraceae bacterium]
MELDLRPHGPMRGVEDEDQFEPLSLTRDQLRLAMLLPVGFKPGPYGV